MAMTSFMTISDLKYGVRVTQMNVRVTHKWERPEFAFKNKNFEKKPDTSNRKKLDAIELLFVDSKNDFIQATIRKQLISHFGSQLSVGEIYTIRNITVDNNTGLDKATPHPYRLRFEYSTRVQKISDPTIPNSLYRFSAFNDILDGVIPPTHYIDVIGKLYEIGPITETPSKHVCRTIRLEDYQGTRLPCTLWEPFASQVPDLINKLPNPEQSKVIVIQCVQTKKFEGSWRIQTTFNATVFNLNPDLPEITEFEPSLSTTDASNSLQVIEIVDDADTDDMTLDSIKSIADLKENKKAGYYYVHGTIVDIDCTAGWFYDSCKLCWMKSTKNDNGKWICKNKGCDGHINGFTSRVPRFQIKFHVSDPCNDTVYLTAFDGQVNQYVPQTASVLLAKIEKSGGDPEDMPRDLEVFLEKSFVFKVNIHPYYNVDQGQTSYTVASMTDDRDIADKWHKRYTEIFKADLSGFKARYNLSMAGGISQAKDLVVHSIDVEEIDSQTEDSSPKITPLKRPIPVDDEDQSFDASSATKKVAIVKTEK